MMKTILLLLTFIGLSFADEIDLQGYEKSLYSKHGEDGVIARLLELIQPQSKFCVDIGAGDGITSSNTYLLRLQGWDCTLFDRAQEKLPFKLYKEFITAENVNDLLKKYHVPQEIGLLTIEHYNDFYLWKALEYRPAIVILKYNATHGPCRDSVAKYRPYFVGDDTDYFGASILTAYHLARAKGYSLVYAESSGTNLFFIRDDMLEEQHLQFIHMNDVEKIYRSSHEGYRQDPRGRVYLRWADLVCD